VSLSEYLDLYNPYGDFVDEEDCVLRDFGERLRILRKKRCLTQQMLGERAGVSYKYLGEIERGEKNPSVTILFKLAAALEVNPAELVCVLDGGCADCHYSRVQLRRVNEILMERDPETLKRIVRVLTVWFGEER